MGRIENQKPPLVDLMDIIKRRIFSGEHVRDIVIDLNSAFNMSVDHEFDDARRFLDMEPDYIDWINSLPAGQEPFNNDMATIKFFGFVKDYYL